MTQLSRNFRRWNRSQSKYEKASRKYQFQNTTNEIKRLLQGWGVNESELQPSTLRDLYTWVSFSTKKYSFTEPTMETLEGNQGILKAQIENLEEKTNLNYDKLMMINDMQNRYSKHIAQKINNLVQNLKDRGYLSQVDDCILNEEAPM